MRYLPTPFHTKFAQERTALSQYIQQEAVGTRMRRWERPLRDFLAPYLRGTVERLTGENIIPAEVEHRRDLGTWPTWSNHLVFLLSLPLCRVFNPLLRFPRRCPVTYDYSAVYVGFPGFVPGPAAVPGCAPFPGP